MNTCVKETEKGKTFYDIDGKIGDDRLTARLQADGKLLRTEETIASDSVPEPVKQAVQKKYPGGEVTTVQKVTSDAAVSYEFNLKHRKKAVDVAFDGNGKEVKIKK